jgi:hypothetical protein
MVNNDRKVTFILPFVKGVRGILKSPFIPFEKGENINYPK